MNDTTLLELVAPRGDEELIGAVMSTFVLDGNFLEEELLTTLAGLAVGSGELARASSELHDRLLAAPAGVTVLVDERGFDGTRHLGMYDLCLVVAPPTFHPKVALTVWQEPNANPVVRGLVTSANLTREGYRRNAEIVAFADSSSPRDHALLADIVGYLRRIAGVPIPLELLNLAEQQLKPSEDRTRRLLVSRGRPLLDLFFEQLADDEVVDAAVVVSPFFERSGDLSSQSTIESWCRRLHSRASDSGVRARFYVPELFRDGQLVVEIPISRAVSVLGEGAELWTLNNLWPLAGRAEPVPRQLHGKLLALQTNRRCLVLAGSANFTNAALLAGGAAANWEACVLLSVQRDTLDHLLPITATRRDPSTVLFQQPEPEPPLPRLLFDRATYEARRRRLRVHPRPRVRAGESWTLHVDGEEVASGSAGGLSVVSATLSRHPTNFSVEQRTVDGSRHIPIEVDDKENLPLPAVGAQPLGDDVLDYFAGLRTPAEFDATTSMPGVLALDQQHLPSLEHLSRFSRALYGITDTLERPARSVLEYRARWTGPWGVQRIVELLKDRIKARLDDPSCSLFEIWELDTTLRELKLANDERCSLEVKQELRDATISQLAALGRTAAKRVDDNSAVELMNRAYRGSQK